MRLALRADYNAVGATKWLQRMGEVIQELGVVGVSLALWGTLLPWAIQPSHHCQKGIPKDILSMFWGVTASNGKHQINIFCLPVLGFSPRPQVRSFCRGLALDHLGMTTKP